MHAGADADQHLDALAHVGSWEWDLCRSYLTSSDELARLYGFEDGTEPGAHEFLAAIPDDDQADTVASRGFITSTTAGNFGWAALTLDNGTSTMVDHIEPKSQGGTDERSNRSGGEAVDGVPPRLRGDEHARGVDEAGRRDPDVVAVALARRGFDRAEVEKALSRVRALGGASFLAEMLP